MINLKKMRNNKKLGLNVSFLKGCMPNGRALVLSEPIEYISDILDELGNVPFYIMDYFDVIIAETEEAAKCVPWADIVFYKEDNAYKNSVMSLETYSKYDRSLLCTNYNAIKQVSKLNRNLKLYNINYLSAQGATSSNPIVTRGVPCGLNKEEPGIHLAKLLGCTQVQYNPSNLDEFVSAKEARKILPVNLIRPNRKPLRETL